MSSILLAPALSSLKQIPRHVISRRRRSAGRLLPLICLALRIAWHAYFIFVTLALICLALRVALHAFPKFVEIS